MKNKDSFNTASSFMLRTALLFICLSGFLVGQTQFSVAQVPQKFSYQAVARDGSGNVLPSKSISIRISILDGSPTGVANYSEVHSVTTNQFGLFTLQIGGGTIVSGSMNNVPWSNGNQWLKVEMDATGGINYLNMGATQLLSVPFAMVAGTTSNIKLDDMSDVECPNPVSGQVLKWNGAKWVPADDNTTGSGSGSSLWTQSGSNIYNFNGGNVGVGNSNPSALLDVGGSNPSNTVLGQFRNSNSLSTSNVLNISNNGTGYNLYSYKTGQSEGAYFEKDNTGSGTANVYITNNGTGNSIDAFATGTGYAGGFHGGAKSLGGIYSTVTGSGYAGKFEGDISGNGIYAGVTGAGYAGFFKGKTKIQSASTNPGVPQLSLYEENISGYARLNFQNASSATSYWGIGGLVSSSAASARMSFAYNSSEDVLSLTGDGNVGMSIKDPLAKLHVYGSEKFSGAMAKIENNNPANANSVLTLSSISSSELITASKSGIGYGINIQKTGLYSATAAVYGATAGNSGEGVRGSAFGNGGYGIYGNAAGNGTNSYFGVYGYASGSSGADYSIYGLQGQGTNDWAGYFSGNVGYTGVLLSTSDAKLKQDVNPVTGSLEKIMQLKPRSYFYRHDGDYAMMHLPEGEQTGLIAQELEKVYPNLVKKSTFTYIDKGQSEKDKEGEVKTTQIDYKGVNYIGLIPELINAIQEQQKEIEELKLQLSQLGKK